MTVSRLQPTTWSTRASGGIYFRFADVQARKQGRHVAQWDFFHFLRSVNDDDHDDHDDDDEE
jgi:hypothetical protein